MLGVFAVITFSTLYIVASIKYSAKRIKVETEEYLKSKRSK
jgi:hypothetical protein